MKESQFYFFILFFLILGPIETVFASDSKACWQKEHSGNLIPFKDANEYTRARAQWLRAQPVSAPNPLFLSQAWIVYKYLKTAPLTTDKQLHCYIGCEVSQQIDTKTAIYLAWLKEDQDLNDCDPNTHFEFLDYQATLTGASFGQSPDADCFRSCNRMKWKN